MRFLIHLTVCLAAATASSAATFQASDYETGRTALVQLRRGADPSAHRSYLASAGLRDRVRHWYDLGDAFQGYALETSDDEDSPFGGSFADDIAVVVASGDVHLVERDEIARAAECQTGAPWHLSRVSQPTFPANNGLYTYSLGPFASNITAYIVDTTIFAAHPEFEGRASIGVSYATGDNGHGTHVAGLVGSRTYGTMKKARIVGVSVLDGSGQGAYSTIAAGVTWAYHDFVARGRSGAVINMSVGGPQSDFINNAVNAVVSGGLPVVVAAGNGEFVAKLTASVKN